MVRIEEFIVIKKLGSGWMGQTELVQHLQSQRIFVWKKIKLPNFSAKIEFERELSQLKRIISPHTIAIIDGFMTDGYYYVIMEYCEKGSLRSYMNREKKKKRRPNEDNLKPENIFLFSENSLKLSDFGMLKHVDTDEKNAGKSQFRTPAYMSPELSQGLTIAVKCDIWALGVLVYEYILGVHPFSVDTHGKQGNILALTHNIVYGAAPPLPSYLSRALREILESMLQKNPSLRPTADQILRNPLFVQRCSYFKANLSTPSLHSQIKSIPSFKIVLPSEAEGEWNLDFNLGVSQAGKSDKFRRLNLKKKGKKTNQFKGRNEDKEDYEDELIPNICGFAHVHADNFTTAIIDPPFDKGVCIGLIDSTFKVPSSYWPNDNFSIMYLNNGYVQHNNDRYAGNSKYSTEVSVAIEVDLDANPRICSFFLAGVTQPVFSINVPRSISFFVFLFGKDSSFEIISLNKLSKSQAKTLPSEVLIEWGN
ncbi:MAG: putative NEK protein kinase [Streblomastix strix]|uniref:non-specific serine/threonine protein kinase n=1 Tax=Streblomastix strix TaxID=222440 RepID=A0A5J4VP51_9EUKA|nr:MAG: putative NEK protein kinase [Streblomastix strix]